MSSQDNAGIPFSYALQPRGYKLLELPDELVELLEGENVPSTLTIYPSATAALLKAAGRTYSLRQKNTSNALILLETADGGSASATAAVTSSSTPPTTTTTTSSAAGAGAGASVTLPLSSQTDQIPPSQQQQQQQRPGLRAIAIVHEVVELVAETDGATAPAARARGKWHERFGRTR